MMTTDRMGAAQDNDAVLVAECLGGGRDAFRRIVERYQSLICSLAYSATGSLSRSEDLAQETFVTAWTQLAELREPEKLRPWLCGIARNLIGKALRRDGREPVHAAETLESAEDSMAVEPLPSERVMSKEEQGILWRSIERIPEIYREPLVLYYREHQSVEKVAVAMDLTEETVRQRLSRGRKLLQEQVLAFVEGALEDTNPGKAFAIGVLAALPLLAASATTASAATAAGTVAAKGTATAKTAAGAMTLGAALTAGVIGLFSLLGFLAFLGCCIGYIMSRAMRKSARQLENVTRFWRSMAIGFAVFVVVPFLAFLVAKGLRVQAGEPEGVYDVLDVWMSAIYVFVPAVLAVWLTRWWRGSAAPSTDAAESSPASRKRFFVWYGLGMLVPAFLFVLFAYGMAFDGSLTSQRLSGAEFQRIVAERKDAKFSVEQYRNGSKSLLIRLPENQRRVTFYMVGDDSTLGLLAANHIDYKTYVEGKDWGQLGTPWRLLGLMGFAVAPGGFVLLLTGAGRKKFYEAPADFQQAETADRKARNAFRAFAVAVGLGLISLAVFIGLMTRWGTRTFTYAELPNVVTEHQFARYEVVQYSNGSKKLHITPRADTMSPLEGPADGAALALLEERGIPYRTIVQGRDFGYADPTPTFSLVCMVLLTTLAVVLLRLAGKGMVVSPGFRIGFAAGFVLLFGATILLSPRRSNFYVSTARVRVAEWTIPAFPGDEPAAVRSKAILGKAVEKLGLDQNWAKRRSHGVTPKPDAAVVMLGHLALVDAFPFDKAGAVEVSVYDDDRQEGAAVANAIAESYCASRNESRPVAQILAAAVPGEKWLPHFNPVLLVIGAAAGILAGLVTGALAAKLWGWRRKR